MKAKKKNIKKKTNKSDNLKVNGSFLDIMQASMKHANNKSAKKKS